MASTEVNHKAAGSQRNSNPHVWLLKPGNDEQGCKPGDDQFGYRKAIPMAHPGPKCLQPSKLTENLNGRHTRTYFIYQHPGQ